MQNVLSSMWREYGICAKRVTVALGYKGQSYLTLISRKGEPITQQLHVFSFQVVGMPVKFGKNVPPPNMPLWHNYYFELKALIKQ